MLKISNVSTLLCCFLLVQVGHSSTTGHLINFGLKEQFFGSGYLFDDIYKVRFKIDFVLDELKLPDKLDCDKYTADSANNGTTSELPRVKREVGNSMVHAFMNNSEFCAYKFDPNDPLNLNASIEEEKFFIEMLKQDNPARIFCANGYSSNCLIKIIYLDFATIKYYKLYDAVENKSKISYSYELHKPKRPIKMMKEIMYRTVNMIELAKNNKEILMSYTCLGDPYSSSNALSEKDPAIEYLTEEYQRLVLANIGTPPKTVIKDVENFSGREIKVDRLIVDEKVAVNAKSKYTKQYEELNIKIKVGLEKLSGLEDRIDEEVIKLNEEKWVQESKTPINNYCREWLLSRKAVMDLYEKRNGLLKDMKNITLKQPEIAMTPDLTEICANSAFVKLESNTIESMIRLRVDNIQKEILTMLGIPYEKGENQYKMVDKLKRFVGQPLYSNLMADVIEFEKDKNELEIKVKNLNNELGILKSNVKKRSESLININLMIDKAEEILNSTKGNLTAEEKERANKKLSKTELEKRLEGEFLKEINLAFDIVETNIPSRSMFKVSKLEYNNRIEKEGVDKVINSTLEKLTILESEIKKMEERLKSHRNIIIDKENLIQNLKIELNNTSTLNTEDNKEIGRLRKDKKNLEKKLTDKDEEWKKKYEGLNIEKRSVDDKLEELGKNTTKLEQELVRVTNEKISVNDTLFELRGNNSRLRRSYESLIQAKQGADDQIKELLANKGVNITVDLSVVDEKIKEVYGKIETVSNELGKHVRAKRDVEAMIGKTLQSSCSEINANIDTVIKNMNHERNILDDSLRSSKTNKRPKRNLLPAVALNALWNLANTGLVGGEYGLRVHKVYELELIINRTYEEFLNYTKFGTNIEDKMIGWRSGVESELDKIKTFNKDLYSALKKFEKVMNNLKDFSVANKVWTIFTLDLTNVQRLLISVLQQNAMKTRLLGSLTTLRNNFLPLDLVNIDDLKKILRRTRDKLPKDVKLAFNESNYMMYYKYPFSNIDYEKGSKIIELRIPVIKTNAELQAFKLRKIKSYPIPCWDTNACHANDNFKLTLENNLVFLNKNNNLVASAKIDDVECMMYFDGKLCFAIDDLSSLQPDPCLETMYNESINLNLCEMKRTNLKAVNIQTKEPYEILRDDNGILLKEEFNTNSDDPEVFIKRPIFDFIKIARSDVKIMSKAYNFEDSKEFADARVALQAIGEDIRAMKAKYENMTVNDMYKAVLKDRPRSTGSGWFGKFALIIPYLIAICIMIISDHWITILASTIIVHPNGAHASMVTDVGAKIFFKKAGEWLYETWIWTMQISGICVVTILLAFIVYHSLYKHVQIYHYYGRILRKRHNSTGTWYIILTTVVKENRLFWKCKHCVVLVIETDFVGDICLSTPDTKSVWVKKTFLNLMQPIEIHIRSGSVHVHYENISLEDRDIIWNNGRGFKNLDSLHGHFADVRLGKLMA